MFFSHSRGLKNPKSAKKPLLTLKKIYKKDFVDTFSARPWHNDTIPKTKILFCTSNGSAKPILDFQFWEPNGTVGQKI